MKRMIRKGKQNRHEAILVTLLSGKPVTPDEIKSCFKGTEQEDVLYRLATNIWNCRLDGAVIKVVKNGRTVSSYQLLNPKDFDPSGRFIQPVTTNTPEKAVEVESEVDTEVEQTETQSQETEVA